MANINKIALPDGTQYDIEDAVARGAISNINSFNIQIVQSLPTTNIDSHTIYLLSKSATVGSSTVGDSTVGGENDTYDEYIYVNNTWEKLGDDIDTEAFARVENIPTKVSDLTDDVGIINIFWVHFTESSESGILVADKTFAELTAAWSSGKLIQATYYGVVYQISTTFDGGYENFAEFMHPVNVDSNNGIVSIYYNVIDWEHQENNDSISYHSTVAYAPGIGYPSYPGFSNGQILQYNSTSGKWEATNLPANEVFLVNISYENGTYVADKTYNEATAAFNSGKIVFARDNYNRMFLFGSDWGSSYCFQTFGSVGEISEYTTLSYYYDGTTNYSLSVSSYDMNLIVNLGDTNIYEPTAGQVLTFQNNRWVNADIPSSSVSSLSDTTITSAANGQVLTYNSSSSKWVNSSIPAQNGSLSISSNVITLTNASGTTSTIALPVYSGSVSTVGGGS